MHPLTSIGVETLLLTNILYETVSLTSIPIIWPPKQVQQ